MMFVVEQVGVGTQANSKQAAMQLSLTKDNLTITTGPYSQTRETGAYVIIDSGLRYIKSTYQPWC
jgi:hypothetical protein